MTSLFESPDEQLDHEQRMVVGHVHHVTPDFAFTATKSSAVALEISVMSTQSFGSLFSKNPLNFFSFP